MKFPRRLFAQATVIPEATPSTIKFEDPAPGYGYTLSGFVDGENESSAQVTGEAIIGSGYTQGANKGTYPLGVNLNTLSAPNYGF